VRRLLDLLYFTVTVTDAVRHATGWHAVVVDHDSHGRRIPG